MNMISEEWEKLHKLTDIGVGIIETYNGQLRYFLDMTNEYKKMDPQMKDFSIEIFKKLMFKYLNRSKLKSKVLYQEQVIPNLEKKSEELSKVIESTIFDFQLEIKNIYEQLEFYKENVTKLHADVEDKLKDVTK